jgi:nucleoside-diphosphate-sugar epimerase
VKVLVTGATGFIGAHSAVAIEGAGHDVRLFVRDPQKAKRIAGSVGLRADDVATGDVTDASSVDKALVGCDAIVHTAAAVSIKRADAQRAIEINAGGAETVLRAAAEHGLSRIIHVSSTSALEQVPGRPLTVTTPIATADGYAASKAAAEGVARGLQDDGAPVHITYPGGVLGPAAGGSLGEASTQISRVIAAGIFPTGSGSLSVVDVRDIAEVHRRLLEPGDAPRRVMCGGTLLTMDVLAEKLRALTGRRFPVPPTPPALLRAIGRAVDRVMTFVPLDLPITEEAMTLLTTWPGTEDNVGELGLQYRPVDDTLADAVRAWLDAGLVTKRQAGRLGPDAG